MKNVDAVGAAAGDAPEPDRDASPQVAVQHADGRTRQAVARLLLERGPVTATAVADVLGLSPAAVRRHLDALIADGEVHTRDATRRGPRTRGRPAKLFLLTELGRARFGHAYDDLAVSVLQFVAEHSGVKAVRAFAQSRVDAVLGGHRDSVRAPSGTAERARALADALTREGYAASIQQVGSGEQLCQHHCPVAHVAAEFPQLCEAETAAFAELLGTHVQRLSTIARGDVACTTHVPAARAVSTGTKHTAADRPYPNAADSEHHRERKPDQPAAGPQARIADGGEPA